MALVEGIYRAYRSQSESDGGGEGDSGGEIEGASELPELRALSSRRIQALIDADAARTPEGDAGALDWDVFIDGQDWELHDVVVRSVAESGGVTQVEARFRNFERPTRIVFDLVREGDRWAIDEVRSLDASTDAVAWTLSKVLAGDPDAVADPLAP